MKFVIEHLSKSFEKKEVLRDIDFTFDEGKIYGLLGRNGAGKTTLFNCLNRDLKADSGNFYIEDENGVRREVAAEDIGYVLSTPTVPEFLTGREFLKFFMDINEKSIKNPKSIDEYFDYMSIEPEATHRPTVISLCRRVYQVSSGCLRLLDSDEAQRLAMDF